MWNLQGSTIWARQTLESDIFYKKPDKWFKIWFFIINRVNHKDNKQFKRAECFTTYTEISSYTGAKVHQIENCIKWLKSATMITTQKATRGMLISVLNYAKFQDAIKTKSHTESHDKSQTEARQKPDRSHTINNNDKNDKNEKNIAETSSAEPFDFKSLKEKMLSSKDKRMIIISTYWTYRKFEFKNQDQYTAGIKRELRASKLLTGYPIERIKEVMFYLNGQEWIDWVLETVHKYIDRDLTKIIDKTYEIPTRNFNKKLTL
jgi:hypothetical protein